MIQLRLILLALVLGLSPVAHAVPIPTSGPSLIIAGRVFTDVKNLITLNFTASGDANTTHTARLPGATAGYQVPTGKQLVIEAMQVNPNPVTTVNRMFLCYSDNDVGSGGTTAFTNAVNMTGNSSSWWATGTPNGENVIEISLGRWIIPAGKYVGMGNGNTEGTASARLFGYLESI